MAAHRFPIGVLIDSFGMPFRKALEIAASMDIQGIQLYAVSGEMAPENMTLSRIDEKRELILSYGLEVSAVCGDLGGHGFTRTEENPARIERSKRIVDLALELSSKIVTTHIGVIPEDTNCEKYKVMQEACNRLAEYANDRGALFAIETGPETAAVLRRFLDSIDKPGLAVNLDPANFVMVTGQDPVDAVRVLGDYIVHTHAKDGIMLRKTDPKIIYDYFADGGIGDLRLDQYFREVPLGEGDVPFTAYLNALTDIGYRGYLTIERETGTDPVKDIKQAAEFLKAVDHGY